MPAPPTDAHDDGDFIEPCELCTKPACATLTLEGMVDFVEADSGEVRHSEEWPELFELRLCEPCLRKPDIERTIIRLAADAADAVETAQNPATSFPELAALHAGAKLAGVVLQAVKHPRAVHGDVIQCNPEHCRWGAVLALVREVHPWGVVAHMLLSEGIAPIRVDHAHYVVIGKAEWL